MECICVFKKTAIFAAACLAVLATLAGCSDGGKKPTPEQVAEREQEKALKGGETMIEKFLHNGKYVKIYEKNAGYSYISVASISSVHITENSVVIHNGFSGSSSLKYDINEYRISIDKERNLIVKPETRQKNKKELEAARKKEQLEERTELLFSAVKSNNLEQAKVCIELGADVNAKSKIKDANGETVLMIAAGEGYKDMAELLIKSGADINAQNNYGKTALMCAANGDNNGRKGNYSSYKDITELLVNSGADVNAKDDKGKTALILAAFDLRKDIAELLIKAGADVNAKDCDGNSALYLATEKNFNLNSCRYNRRDLAELLIPAGADTVEVFIQAIKYGDWKANVTKTLINVGADVNAKDGEGISMLTYAILYGRSHIEKLFRDAGAKE